MITSCEWQCSAINQVGKAFAYGGLWELKQDSNANNTEACTLLSSPAIGECTREVLATPWNPFHTLFNDLFRCFFMVAKENLTSKELM